MHDRMIAWSATSYGTYNKQLPTHNHHQSMHVFREYPTYDLIRFIVPETPLSHVQPKVWLSQFELRVKTSKYRLQWPRPYI